MHTVTILDPTLPWKEEVSFNSRIEAHQHARTLKNSRPHIQVIITDKDDGVVELRTNGWSRVTA